ncbi:DUF4446 family protein [Patescibacteria group bacterium]|nr:DUF4446 family protein [Patescibacteria group bacterium]MBU2579573.1 DUF4446 family protein [Patescibacteria group bacterium]
MLNILIENPFFFVFLGGIIFLALWNVLLQIQHWLIRKKLKTFFNGKKASDLEGVLFEEIKRLKKAEEGIKGLSKNLKSVEKMAERSIQKASVVRFNPFKETGGDQSFVIALLDSRDNGLVITSLFTRQGNRVYSKPIKEGKSTYPLSKEETEALKKAGMEK